MKLSLFDYSLPKELIAQFPSDKRDHSRLLVLDRKKGKISHHYFYDLPHILDMKTVVVLNNTKVFKARLFGKFPQDKTESEVFLLKKVGENLWQCLTNPGRKFHPGKTITFIPGRKDSEKEHLFEATVRTIQTDGSRLLQFSKNVEEWLEQYGHTPLPPYIKQDAPLERYQTIYAKKDGSVAAPTAGLHFTPEVFQQLAEKGIETAEVTLHVGVGTFLPVKTENIEDHVMHREIFSLSKETARHLNQAKHEGKKVLAVGTTSMRVLEHCSSTRPVEAHSNMFLQAQSGHTDIFIYPGYTFKFVDILLTNFHLPKSTLLMLVSAFAGRDLIMKAYEEAIREKYRFYSFGDAMLIM